MCPPLLHPQWNDWKNIANLCLLKCFSGVWEEFNSIYNILVCYKSREKSEIHVAKFFKFLRESVFLSTLLKFL